MVSRSLLLSCIYITIYTCIFRKELIILQYWISSVLAFGLLEACLEYGYFMNWNDTGVKHTAIAIAGSVFGVTKRTLSRVVVQLAALGYGIVRPTLGEEMHRVIFLGSVYFVLSLIYTLATKFSTNAASMSDPQYNFISLIILMIAAVDTTFYMYVNLLFV